MIAVNYRCVKIFNYTHKAKENKPFLRLKLFTLKQRVVTYRGSKINRGGSRFRLGEISYLGTIFFFERKWYKMGEKELQIMLCRRRPNNSGK